MSKKYPPFSITNEIVNFCAKIEHLLGLLEGLKLGPAPSIKLRRTNKIKTIQSTLAIEGNSLGIENVRDIFEDKWVIAPQQDITEVKNAIFVYNKLHTYDIFSIDSFQNAHSKLMINLISTNGKFRSKGVGIFKGQDITHIAPPFKQVPRLINNLFNFLKEENIIWLIKACVFHYELEFIHPFEDGNGRMGRLWQQLILMHWNPIFEFVSVEYLIKNSQQSYYKVLEECDKDAEATKFIEYMLEQIFCVLDDYFNKIEHKKVDVDDRLNMAKKSFGKIWFSRKEYYQLHKNISMATASRDLTAGVKNKEIKKCGEKNQTKYRFIL